MRAAIVAVLLMFLTLPEAAMGQSSGEVPSDTGGGKFSLQASAGPTVRDEGYVVSAAAGYALGSRVELIFNVERTHLPFQANHYENGSSALRGGTMTFASGELRVSVLPPDRISPFAVAGIGRGYSRPTVNATFPDPVKNELRVGYLGGGVRVPIRRGLGAFVDARLMLALEGYDGLMGLWPVRAGLTWRF
jgi:hypothetical protein